jgi:hypothetical protein
MQGALYILPIFTLQKINNTETSADIEAVRKIIYYSSNTLITTPCRTSKFEVLRIQ